MTALVTGARMVAMLTKLKYTLAALVLPMVTIRTMAASHGTADEVAANWQRGLANATAKATAGAQRVSTAPGRAAAQAAQKWQMALQGNDVLQKYQTNVGAVTLQAWQDAYVNKGVPRMSSGAQNAIPKFTAVMSSLLPYIDQQVSVVKGMPSNTYDDREQRMVAFSRAMRNYKKPAGT